MKSNLFDQLRELELPATDYAIFGSGPLAIREIIPSCNDLDVMCRGPAWNLVGKLGITKYLEEYDVTIVSLADDKITFGTRWGIGDVDTDVLIDTAETIGDLQFVNLSHVVNYKTLRSSAKDQAHLAALGAWGYPGRQ